MPSASSSAAPSASSDAKAPATSSASQLGERSIEALNDVVAHVRLQHPPGGERARAPGHDHLADLELLREPDGVHRAGAAERDEGEVARVDPLLDGDRPHRVRHLRVDDREHPLGELGRPEPDLAPRPSERALGRALVERHPAAEEVARVEPAEEEVRVGHGRLRSAAPVAGRARIGAGALRPDAQAARLEPGERAAAGADRVDVDERHQHGQALELGLGRDGRLAVDDEAEVERRAAHVDAEQVAPAGRAGERRAADRPADRPREQRLDRLAARASRGRDAAVRLHHVERARDVELAELALERAEVALDPRRDVGVQHRGRGALVLAPLAGDLVRERDRQLGELGAQQRHAARSSCSGLT